MEIIVDQKKFNLSCASLSLQTVLDKLFADYSLGSPFKYAVALNGELLPRRAIKETSVSSSDKIELISIIAGG